MSHHSSPSVNSYGPITPENDDADFRGSNGNLPLDPRFANSPILLEKALNSDKIDISGKRLIRGFGWKKFVKTPRGRVNVSVVREFYSALKSTSMIEPDQIVVVRGVAVPFSHSVVNQVFDIPPVTLPHFEVSWELNNYYNRLNKVQEAFQCLFPFYDTIRDTSTMSLLSHLKAWKHFINSRVYPTQDFASINDDEMLLLYALAFGVYVDWGTLIHRTALTFAISPESRGQPMPYSWMISHLCIHMSRVEEYGMDEFLPAKNNHVGLLPVDTPGCSSTI